MHMEKLIVNTFVLLLREQTVGWDKEKGEYLGKLKLSNEKEPIKLQLNCDF